MTKTYLQKKISPRVAAGHPWIFGNEIDKIDGKVDPGDIVEVYTYDNKFVGKGYINLKSQITVRLLTRDKNEIIDENFFFKKILAAWQ
ncbi:MAG TPA: rRNA large subunit methyltransferase I, partial [Segetibacter sp.]